MIAMKPSAFLPFMALILVIFPFSGGEAAPPPPPYPPDTTETVVEQAIRSDIQAQSDFVLGYLVNEIQISALQFSPDGAWAAAELALIDAGTGSVLPSEPVLALGMFQNDQWVIVLPNEPGWMETLAQVPDSLISENDRQGWMSLYEQAHPLSADTTYSGFKLPFAAGQGLVLTQSISHYNPPNPSGSMHFSFDFAAWHDQTGESPMFAVHAAKGGSVRWAKWDQTNGDATSPGNYLVVEDTSTSPYTYHLYLHLAKDSIPEALRTRGAPILQGQYLGLADDTGLSSGNHLHFQVHTNPNSYWGTAVDITFSDVSINGGRPRTPTEASNWPQYGSQGQWEYFSSNTVPGNQSLPWGAIDTPKTGETIENDELTISGLAADDQGLESIQIQAYYGGIWKNIGPAFSSSPFSYTWNLCSTQVPDGPLSLALDIRDTSGNSAPGLVGLTHLNIHSACPPAPPACSPSSNQIALFADPDYGGACVVLGTGTHAVTSLGSIGEDNAESILLGTQVWATLFNGSQQGRGETFFESDRNLSENWIGSNRVSSLLVRAAGTLPSAPRMVYPAAGAAFMLDASTSLVWDDLGGGDEFQVKLDTVDYPWQSLQYLQLSGLSLGTHTWQVRARNAGGTGDWSASRTFIIEASILAPETPDSVAPFVDNMENGYNEWIRDEWDQTQEQNHTVGGQVSFNYEVNDQLNDYDTGSPNEGSLTSPLITIPAPGYYLRFWYRYETEGSGVHWDQRWVQISSDGGPYANLLQLSNDPLGYWLQSPALDVSAYAGHNVRIRFYFATLDAVDNEHAGWYIDDLTINSDAPPACTTGEEEDESPISSRQLTYSTTLEGQICSQGDMDYFHFSGFAGEQVGISARAATPGSLDTLISLLDDDFATILAENDDRIAGILTDSFLPYRLPRDGDYYVKIQAWDHPSAGGSAAAYQLSLTGDDSLAPLAELVTPLSYAALNVNAQTILVSAQDIAGTGETVTGVSHVEFMWHSSDWGALSTWVNLGSDWDSSDGWSYNFDTTGLSEQSELAIYVRVYDWAGNWRGLAAWDLRIDRPPFDVYMPVVSY